MTENETSIREALTEYAVTAKSINSDPGAWSASNAVEAFDALLAEHRAEVEALRDELRRANESWSRARAEALEEAAARFDKESADCERLGLHTAARVNADNAEMIRELITTPAPATVPVERVRDVLTDLGHGTGNDGAEEYDKACRDFAKEAARRLGVDLDAKGECPVCEEPEGQPHKMSCRPQNREDAERKAIPANLARCGCGDYAFSHRNNTGPCIINGCECPGFLAATVTR